MSVVKSSRPYESPRRREQAEQTRTKILGAARRLFETQGYPATSMSEIAVEAGVALKTLYVTFDSKAGLLRALWHLLLRGDQGASPVGERAWFREVLDEPDPRRQLRLNARNSRVVKERAGELMGVLAGAAATDPGVQALWDRIQREFYDNQRTIILALQRKKALKPGLGTKRATDALWTLNHPDIYRLLVKQCGWKPAQYERWFADAACSLLLAPARP
jgi:AcrR family transcriptional regulator